MTPRNAILQGEALERLGELAAASVHAVVTDPPYGLHFMGRAWDHGLPDPAIWAECLRVLKPGGHLVIFGGTRTFHRLWCAVEDSGFEVRDTLCWLYGQGFPKSLNVSKAIDMACCTLAGRHFMNRIPITPVPGDHICPSSIEGEGVEGWGTALKPGWEPILLARAPFRGTVAANVLMHGTGALNVGACRIEITEADQKAIAGRASAPSSLDHQRINNQVYGQMRRSYSTPDGRWPANVALDAEAAALLDAQSGRLVSGMMAAGQRRNASKGRGGWFGGFADEATAAGTYGDTGGASRFFYIAKAHRREREAGLREAGLAERMGGTMDGGTVISDGRTAPKTGRILAHNHHPTVKPIALMRWLVRMVTPPGGVVLDPLCGSGSTLCAAALEGFDWLGIEAEAEYVAIARARVAHWAKVGPRLRRLEALRARAAEIGPALAQAEEAEAAGQGNLFEGSAG